jgi:hypothetical protein
MSAATPTTRQGADVDPSHTYRVRPIGFSSGHVRSTNERLTIATGAPVATSAVVNERPDTRRAPIVSKKPGPTSYMSVVAASARSAVPPVRRVMRVPDSGVSDAVAIDVTPGNSRRRLTTRSTAARVAAAEASSDVVPSETNTSRDRS